MRIDLGKAQGIMPVQSKIQGERYYPGQRLKVYLRCGARFPRLHN